MSNSEESENFIDKISDMLSNINQKNYNIILNNLNDFIMIFIAEKESVLENYKNMIQICALINTISLYAMKKNTQLIFTEYDFNKNALSIIKELFWDANQTDYHKNNLSKIIMKNPLLYSLIFSAIWCTASSYAIKYFLTNLFDRLIAIIFFALIIPFHVSLIGLCRYLEKRANPDIELDTFWHQNNRIRKILRGNNKPIKRHPTPPRSPSNSF